MAVGPIVTVNKCDALVTITLANASTIPINAIMPTLTILCLNISVSLSGW
jgi:hypothetical protein